MEKINRDTIKLRETPKASDHHWILETEFKNPGNDRTQMCSASDNCVVSAAQR